MKIVTVEFGYAAIPGRTDKQPIHGNIYGYEDGIPIDHYFTMPDGTPVYLSIFTSEPTSIAEVERRLEAKCDGNHAMPECTAPNCWHKDPPGQVSSWD